MSKFIKLFSGHTGHVEKSVNDFITANEPDVQFIEVRPYNGHAGQQVGALACLQYEADAPIVEPDIVAE